MIEQIDFEDTNHEVSIKIDNETKRFSIKKIKKLSTYIELNQSLNTALENNIEVDASILYIKRTGLINIEDNEISTEVVEEEDYPNDINLDTKFLTRVNNNNDLSLNIDGVVTITIYNGTAIYYQKDVHFIKGHITDSIKNKLPLGSYQMVISYAGNKYFEPSSLTIDFNVEKRLGVCLFNSERYYGDFTQTIVINGTLKDDERGTVVKNCKLNYDFDGETFDVTTDNNGNFTLTATIPSPNLNHCNVFYETVDESEFEPGDLYEEEYEEEFIDEDGNIRLYSDIEEDNTLYNTDLDDDTNAVNNKPQSEINDIVEDIEESFESDIENIIHYANASYILSVYTNNESYYLDTTEIEIIANKAPVSVTVESSNANTVSNILKLHGSVLARYMGKDNDVQYGKINIVLPDFNYKHPTVNVINGVFETDIDLAEVYNVYNTNDIDVSEYDTTKTIYTEIELTGDIYDEEEDNKICVGKTFIIEGKVKSNISTDYIKDGILIFYLYDSDDNLVYNYATELDRTGVGIFNFSTSREQTYTVQAEYVGIFGYQNSKSKKAEVRVIECHSEND